MENASRILEIASSLEFKDLQKDLERIIERSKKANAELIFPLVGEFSSGKTTLLNALTDCKKLETATKPTTATIYELHFGCEKCSANVLTSNGQLEEYDIDNLKNEVLKDATVVNIFDTSTRVPSTTILVDTPGLSSPDPKHKQTLVDFLPYADGILLVTDVNQQITRSLTDFIDTMKLSKKPIYLVITKCDTKSSSDLEAAKTYISDNCKLPIQQIACVSASKDELQELYTMFDTIQKDKNDIVKKVDGQRLKNIVKEMLVRIEDLLKASSSDKDLDEAIRRQEYELNVINRNIERLIDDTKSEIEDKERSIVRNFEDTVSERLEVLVTGKSENFDADAVSAINNTASLLFNDYKVSIQRLLQEKAHSRRNTDDGISLRSLEEMDMSSYSISGLSYNLDLNSAGHQYDGWISTGVKVAAAVGAVVAVASTGGASAVAAAATVDNAIDVADTVSDVSSIVSNNRTVDRIERVVSLAGKASDQFDTIDGYNQRAGQQVGANKGIVESMVGFVTDKTWGKPQRKRAIRNYMDNSLMPDFKREITVVGNQLIANIRIFLQEEASETIDAKRSSLEKLKQERKDKKDAYNQRINQIRDYKHELMTL
ncbi:MAG: dynamin family protein [Bacteroides sp.]|nr:dynamin family protein [Bacteroides sp.]